MEDGMFSRRTSRALFGHQQQQGALGQIEVKNPEIMAKFYELDMCRIELRQLAIRIQKNGGVDFADHRKNGQTYRRTFATLEFVRWLVDTFGLSRDLACLICKEMWKQGIIWDAEDPYAAFSVSEGAFYQVAHPYAINLLLLPSEMEQLYEEARDRAGPKRVDKYLGGRQIHSCFPSSELVEWIMSVYSIKPRERALQVVQQMANEGYFFNVNGSDHIVDSSSQYLQHKHDYIGNLILSKRRMASMGNDIANLYELCVDLECAGRRPPVTVSLAASLIENLIQDCSFVKAKHVLLMMKRAKFVQVQSSQVSKQRTINSPRWHPSTLWKNLKGLSSMNQEQTLLRELGNDGDPVNIMIDGAFVNLKTRRFKRSNSGAAVHPEAEDGGTTEDELEGQNTIADVPKMRLSRDRGETKIQNLAVTLMSHLGGRNSGKLNSSQIHQSARSQIYRAILHIIFCFTLWTLVFSSTQTELSLNEGLKETIKTSNNFNMISSAKEFLVWTQTEIENGFSWRGTQYTLLEPPHILFGIADKLSECSSIQKLVTSAAQKATLHTPTYDPYIPIDNESVPTECYLNRDSHADGAENSYDYASLVELSCVDNITTCPEQFQYIQNKYLSAENEVLVERMALEVTLLGFKANPPVIVRVTAHAKFSAIVNTVLVRFIHVPDQLSLSPLEHFLIFMLVMVSLDFILLACLGGSSFLFDVSKLFHVARIILPIIGLHIHKTFEIELFDYLSTISWDNSREYQGAKREGFERLHHLDLSSRVCFVGAMFLVSMSLASYIGGPKYNIFDVLQKTLKSVHEDVKVLAITFVITFVGFVSTLYAIMNSLSSLFATPSSTGMTLYGSLFGGAPWSTFMELRSTSRILSTLGFVSMAMYLFLFIIMILNMFVAIIIQSYQAQKHDEAVLRAEFIRHLHASEGTSDISTLKNYLGERLYEIVDNSNDERKNLRSILAKSISNLADHLRSSAKVHHANDSIISQSTSEAMIHDPPSEIKQSSAARPATFVRPPVARQDSKILKKPAILTSQPSSTQTGLPQNLPKKLQHML